MNEKIFKRLIDESHGKILSVTFTKLDGSVRTLTGRVGVKKYLKGGERTTSPHKYAILYDVQKKAYRNVAYDRIKSIRTEGVAINPRTLKWVT
jgi:hypothetical protein